MIIRTSKNSDYSVINNTVLNDERLSWRARGIAAYLLSKPDNWSINSTHLWRSGTEGRDAVRAALKELENAGYLRRRKQQDDQGKFSTDLFLFEKPQPTTENQASVNQSSVNQASLLSTDEQVLNSIPSSIDENSSIPSVDGSECLQQSLLNQETNTPPPLGEAPPLTPHQQMFGAICEVTGTDAGRLMTQKKRGQVSKVGKLLREAGYTSRDVEAWYKDVWLKDWRGQKGGRPTITQVQEEIHKVRELPSRDDAGWGFNTGEQW